MVRTRKKVATEKSKKAAPKKAAGGRMSKKAITARPLEITPEERWRMIAVAAYHKSERHGFALGREIDDWLEAEREIDELLGRR